MPYIMNDDTFQWGDRKAASNYAKHGVSFEVAREVFRDPFAVEQIDDREDYGEVRFAITGMAKGRLLSVIYTMRTLTIRINSARAAEPYEQRDYHEQNT